MGIGDLVKSQHKVWGSEDSYFLAEICGFFDKRDIDYDCPQSVAIIPMVKVTVLTGKDAGKTRTYSRKNFRQLFLTIKDTK